MVFFYLYTYMFIPIQPAYLQLLILVPHPHHRHCCSMQQPLHLHILYHAWVMWEANSLILQFPEVINMASELTELTRQSVNWCTLLILKHLFAFLHDLPVFIIPCWSWSRIRIIAVIVITSFRILKDMWCNH